MGKSARKKKAKTATTEAAPTTSPEQRLNLDEMIRKMNQVSLSASNAAVGSEVPSETARSWIGVGSGSNSAGLTSARAASPWEEVRSDMSSPEIVYTPSNDEDSLDRQPPISHPNREQLEKLRYEFDQRCVEYSQRSREGEKGPINPKGGSGRGQDAGTSSTNPEARSTGGTEKDQKEVKSD